mmetsp:Transcript_29718/g.64941  ORF Transcript_29718/g.64941 Transcript_29718/m.64941 type:complete len:249 (+) Transcript_29718:126-872(+)
MHQTGSPHPDLWRSVWVHGGKPHLQKHATLRVVEEALREITETALQAGCLWEGYLHLPLQQVSARRRAAQEPRRQVATRPGGGARCPQLLQEALVGRLRRRSTQPLTLFLFVLLFCILLPSSLPVRGFLLRPSGHAGPFSIALRSRLPPGFRQRPAGAVQEADEAHVVDAIATFPGLCEGVQNLAKGLLLVINGQQTAKHELQMETWDDAATLLVPRPEGFQDALQRRRHGNEAAKGTFSACDRTTAN